VDEILALKVPVALSVLPFCPYSAESARKAHEGGMEVLLHLPMEPLDYPEKNPGKGALLIDMTDEEIKNQLEEDIKAVPYASGANNHMGSGFTEYEKKMEVVLRRLKDRGFFFVDSCTTNNSKSRKAAQSVGIRYASRDVFIDNSINFDDTFAILKNLSDKNKKWKSLVIIGHSHESTIRAMGEALPVLRSGNISIVPLSDLINNG
jgi:hypothetical protein